MYVIPISSQVCGNAEYLVSCLQFLFVMLLELVVGGCKRFRMACRSHVEGEAVYEYFNL